MPRSSSLAYVAWVRTLGVACASIVFGCHLADQVIWDHQPGQLDGGRERGVGRPDVDDPVGGRALERRGRLAVVAVLGV